MKYFIVLCFTFITCICSCGSDSNNQKTNVVENILCKDSSAVLKMAEDTLRSLLDDEVDNRKPFRLDLSKDSIWAVIAAKHTLSLGGVTYIEIQMSDCKILKISHGA